MALVAISYVFLALATSLVAALVFGVLMGIGRGPGAAQLALYGDYFGRGSLGKIQGALMTCAVPLAVAGPLLAGLMADHVAGGYRLAFLIMALASAIAAGLQIITRAPTTPASRT